MIEIKPRISCRHDRQSGQVLVTGIFILIILLLLVFAGFDVYNAIRSKIKIETAQESAAIAGASWQRDSLNLIGEINLVKACSLLLEGDGNWVLPLPPLPDEKHQDYMAIKALRARMLQARINILTEMQSRISFIGPLVGLAAAQQAAKANGIANIGNLDHYIFDLRTSSRYNETYGGAKTYINNYAWKEPYIRLIETISRNGIAVYPNSLVSVFPRTDPPVLALEGFYQDIHRKIKEITAAEGNAIYPQTSWGNITGLFNDWSNWPSFFQNTPWWNIDYNNVAFPNESEVFTLGVSVNNSRDIFEGDKRTLLKNVSSGHLLPANQEEIYDRDNPLRLPPENVRLDFFSYDNTWYPSHFRERYEDYDESHYIYWFKGETLRRHVKAKYIYEGPAAYVETFADLGKTTSIIRITGQQTHGSDTLRFGSNRPGGVVSDLTDYRPGTIAKPLGALDENTPPIGLPVVLPVFNKVSIMPTYMPIPYNFGVLRPDNGVLRRFLAWLSTRDSLDDESGLPAGGEYYLEALRYLNKGFLNYYWNVNFDLAKFDNDYRDKLAEWYAERAKEPDKYQYSFNGDQTLPGYAQEPNTFTACPMAGSYAGVVGVPDLINGGTAYRHFIKGSKRYMVVDSKGHIVNRTEKDPTWDPNCCATCHFLPGKGPLTQYWDRGGNVKKGPPR